MKNAFFGFAMALANSVPGVSGGTIAFLMGFYDELITSLRNMFIKDDKLRKSARRFLARLAAGWLVGMAIAMSVLAGLMDKYIYQISSMFVGFILASIPAVAWKERKTLLSNLRTAPFMLPGFALVFCTTYFSTQTAFELNLAHVSLVNGLVLFIASAAAASAMILPGISGSSLLMAFGIYAPLVQQAANLIGGRIESLPVVLIYGAGALTGLLMFIRLVKVALARHRAAMMFSVLGMMLGSLYGVIQGPATLENAVPALDISNFDIPFFLIGCALIAFITFMEHRRSLKMNKAKTAKVGIITLMLALGMFSLVALADGWTPQDPCFGETPYYQYQDDSRSISVKKYEENGVTFFVADVQLADVSGFKIELSGGKAFGGTKPLSKMASRVDAILAINGDGYGTHKYGTIIRNGQLLRAHDTTRNMLIVAQNGDLSVRVDRIGEDYNALAQQLIAAGTLHTFEFGPELIRDGQAVQFSREFDVISTSSSRCEPRTAIGQLGSLHYIIVVADGRQDGYSKGMTLPELQQVFLRFGTRTAMNLDGGGSTELWFNGEVINRPSQGKERSLSDIIYF